MKNIVIPLLMILIFTISCQRSVDKTAAFFGVEIGGINYAILDQSDKWIPFNGNGEYYLRLSLSSTDNDTIKRILEEMNDNGAQQLPIKERDTIISSKLKKYYSANDGLYILKVDGNDVRDYYLLVFDNANKELIIQIIDE